MANYPACSVVVTYDEDTQRLNLQLVKPTELRPAAAKAFKAPILLDDFDFELDDEFARRFGASVLNLIALGQPDIKQFMTVTQYPLDSSGNREGSEGD